MKCLANKMLAMMLVALGLTAVVNVTTYAQTQIKWSVVSSGGIVGSTSGNQYTVSATIGQPSIGNLTAGGKNFDLGFWAYVVTSGPNTGLDEDPASTMSILSNYPNPFVGNTTIRYNLANAGNVTLKIYDIAGRLVRVLVDEYQAGGEQSVSWNGKDGAEGELSAGSYTYELSVVGGTGNFRQRQQMMLTK